MAPITSPDLFLTVKPAAIHPAISLSLFNIEPLAWVNPKSLPLSSIADDKLTLYPIVIFLSSTTTPLVSIRPYSTEFLSITLPDGVRVAIGLQSSLTMTPNFTASPITKPLLSMINLLSMTLPIISDPFPKIWALWLIFPKILPLKSIAIISLSIIAPEIGIIVPCFFLLAGITKPPVVIWPFICLAESVIDPSLFT